MKKMEMPFFIIKLNEELKNELFSMKKINKMNVLINLIFINIKKGKR